MALVRSHALLILACMGIIIFTSAEHAQQYNETLDCDRRATITSPEHPENYPNNANIEWNILNIQKRRFLVTFNFFKVKKPEDMVLILDPLNKLNDGWYTGEHTDLPPYLSQGNRLTISFTSSISGQRPGFNLTISCYEQAFSITQVRLVNSDPPEEGLVELLRVGGNWTRVCGNDFEDMEEELALVICRQLGYPAVEGTFFENGACAGRNCVRAPQCSENSYRLDDCSVSYEECQSHNGLRVQCHKSSYIGCYELDSDALKDEFNSKSISDCVSSCQSVNPDAIAAVRGRRCMCTSTTAVHLDNRALNNDMCHQPENVTQFWRRLYTTSSGFCEPLEIPHGTVEPSITWFGSIVSISCEDGYNLTGASRLKCGPGVSTYHPVWNDSLPICTKIPELTISLPTTSQTTDIGSTKSVNTPTPNSPGTIRKDLYYTIVISIIIIITTIIIIIILAIPRSRNYLIMKLQISRQSSTTIARRTGRTEHRNDTLSRGPDMGDTQDSWRAARTGSTRGHGSTALSTSPDIGDVLSRGDARQPNTFNQPPSQTQQEFPRRLTLLMDAAQQRSSASHENPYYIPDADGRTQTRQKASVGIVDQELRGAHALEPKEIEMSTIKEFLIVNRPLPHRPTSWNITEGPLLPPRTPSKKSIKKAKQANAPQKNKFPDAKAPTEALFPIVMGVASSAHRSSFQQSPPMLSSDSYNDCSHDNAQTGCFNGLSSFHPQSSNKRESSGDEDISRQPRSSSNPYYFCLENEAVGGDTNGKENGILLTSHAPDTSASSITRANQPLSSLDPGYYCVEDTAVPSSLVCGDSNMQGVRGEDLVPKPQDPNQYYSSIDTDPIPGGQIHHHTAIEQRAAPDPDSFYHTVCHCATTRPDGEDKDEEDIMVENPLYIPSPYE